MHASVNKPPLSLTHPHLLKEWDYDKNNALGIYPDKIRYGSHRKVWWICQYGHEWQSTIANRTNLQRGCPVCAGQKVLVGFNDLATVNPKLASEWHPTKNGNLKASDVTVSSGKKVWWICAHGHEWYASVASRTNMQSGCPICAGQKALAGFNDLATVNPKVALEWHPTKNGNLKPTQVTVSSGRKVWWICKFGHEWQSTIGHRTNKSRPRGCPVCAGQKVLVGFNDLATVNSTVASDWHPTKNGNLKPSDVTQGTHRKVWWICKYGHEWQSTVNDRTNKSQPQGCPVCSGHQVLAGFNDLATVNPKLALEWHPTKNGNLKPSYVTQGSNKKVWWICKYGHEWYASVVNRTNRQSGCPVCARLATTSYPESIVSYYIQSLGTPCILQASNVSISQLGNMSVDLYLPAYNLAIEYDGSFYHPEGIERKSRDYKKDAALASSSVNLIRIRDDAKMKKPFTCSHLKHYISYRYSCKNQDYENLQFVIQDIITNQLHLPNEVDFDLVRDNDKINKIKDCMNRSVNVDMCKEV